MLFPHQFHHTAFSWDIWRSLLKSNAAEKEDFLLVINVAPQKLKTSCDFQVYKIVQRDEVIWILLKLGVMFPLRWRCRKCGWAKTIGHGLKAVTRRKEQGKQMGKRITFWIKRRECVGTSPWIWMDLLWRCIKIVDSFWKGNQQNFWKGIVSMVQSISFGCELGRPILNLVSISVSNYLEGQKIMKKYEEF